MGEQIKAPIKKVGQDDPSYAKAIALTTKRKNQIDYRELADLIRSGQKDDIIQVAASKSNYTNIKRGLEARKLTCNVDYSMVFSGEDEQEVFYITVMG